MNAPGDAIPAVARESARSPWSTRIVDADTGAPIAGARVWFVPDSLLVDPRWPELGTLVDDPLVRLAQEPSIGSSAANGSIALPEPTVDSLVAAAIPGRFGARFVRVAATARDTDHRPIEVRLFRDSTLHVEVVDSSDTPRSFVPVDLVTYPYESSFGEGALVHRALPAAGATRVEIRHALWRLAGGGRPGLDEHGSFAVRTGVLLLVNPERTVEAAHVEGEAMRLVAPPCGPIRVRALAPDRSIWSGGGRVTALEAQWFGRRTTNLRTGEALFHAVSVVPGFSAAVELDDSAFAAITVAAASDRVPWTETLLLAPFAEPGTEHTVFTGRLLDVDGRPLADTECLLLVPPNHVAAYDARLFDEPIRFSTTSDGRFRIPFQDVNGLVPQSIVVADAGRGTRAFDAGRCASLSVAAPLPARPIDLGTIRLERVPVLLAGTVRTSSGRPIADANLFIAVEGDVSRAITSRADGSFCAFASSLGREVSVIASFRSVVAAPRTFDVGATDVVIELPAFGTLEGRVLVDDGVAADTVRIRTGEEIIAVDADGKFAQVSMPEGPHDLRVEAVHAPASALATIDGVRVEDGAVVRDPRLTIDLRGRLFRLAGRVVTPSGAPIPRAKVESGFGVTLTTDDDGRFAFVLPERSTRIEARARKFAPTTLDAATDGVVITLVAQRD
ncbi:MAG: carboxypeptidase regulatory-like domain-containing protein [Planctomycetes bacterium]|nr:carboxypeptidase regulatory-like domain-containing protein [Planctomycetota bacterium]